MASADARLHLDSYPLKFVDEMPTSSDSEWFWQIKHPLDKPRLQIELLESPFLQAEFVSFCNILMDSSNRTKMINFMQKIEGWFVSRERFGISAQFHKNHIEKRTWRKNVLFSNDGHPDDEELISLSFHLRMHALGSGLSPSIVKEVIALDDRVLVTVLIFFLGQHFDVSLESVYQTLFRPYLSTPLLLAREMKYVTQIENFESFYFKSDTDLLLSKNKDLD